MVTTPARRDPGSPSLLVNVTCLYGHPLRGSAIGPEEDAHREAGLTRAPNASSRRSVDTWKWRTGKRRSVRAAIHFSCRRAWHLGQWRLRQELYAGRSEPHERHASTWPPSAVVRHSAMAESTLRCASVKRTAASSAARCCRTMSAMSKRGRPAGAGQVVTGDQPVFSRSRGLGVSAIRSVETRA
jgi:hypothetical protein